YTLAQYTVMLAGASMDIILQYTAPFWVALFSKVFFHERLNTSQILAMVVAAFGTICVCSSGGSLAYKAPLLGICTGLITGICYASHYPFTRIWQKKYSSATIFFHLLLGGSLGIFIFSCLCYPENLSLFTKAGSFAPKVWLAAAAMGIFCTYLAFVCFGLALKKIGLVQAVITSEIEPVFSIFWVWLFYDENFSALGWLGSFAILASVLLLSVAKAHEG
ncbi:MAG: DMT family transporter, partial [Desulfovibrio sp.]|nr:DMT family transporter [Desulfovibrio sp.]